MAGERTRHFFVPMPWPTGARWMVSSRGVRRMRPR